MGMVIRFCIQATLIPCEEEESYSEDCDTDEIYELLFPCLQAMTDMPSFCESECAEELRPCDEAPDFCLAWADEMPGQGCADYGECLQEDAQCNRKS